MGGKKKGEFVSIFGDGIFLCLPAEPLTSALGQSSLEVWFSSDPDCLAGFEEMDG